MVLVRMQYYQFKYVFNLTYIIVGIWLVFSTFNEYRLAGELEAGEKVLTYHSEATVTSNEKKAGSEVVYNLEVKDLHNFLVGESGVVVHNNYGIIETIVNAAKNVGKAFDANLINGTNFGKCKEKAKAIRKHLRDNGVQNPKSKRWQLIDNKGKSVTGNIGWDELDANGNLVKTHQIATEGFHEFTIINDKVFDNINPNGIPMNEFLDRLHIDFRYSYKEIEIFD